MPGGEAAAQLSLWGERLMAGALGVCLKSLLPEWPYWMFLDALLGGRGPIFDAVPVCPPYAGQNQSQKAVKKRPAFISSLFLP